MPVGTPVHFFDEIASTNDEAARRADLGAPEGTTIVASAQTAGRGRFGRTWFSPAGAGLYVSVIVRDRRAAPFLSLAGGVAVADGIRIATGLPVELKWPNDVVIDDGRGKRRKLAGILAEATTSTEGIQYVILGFGINVQAAAYPPEIRDRATSLESELGRPVDRELVLTATLAELEARLAQLAFGTTAPVLARWRELAPSASGSPVEWDTPSGVRSGRTEGIDDDGALRVRADGAIERIISGIVRWT